MTKNQETIGIVGAGQAGCELALALRQQGCAASIELFGEETHPPYQRPPLSKAYLKGEVEKTSLHLRQQDVYARANIELVLGARVERIDPRSQRLTLSNGEERTYDRLALTTGGRPRKLAVKDAQRAERANNFGYLRTIEHVLNIRPRFEAGQRLVIIGGGYIGLEVAAAAVACGLNVTVLEAFERVLARVTAPEISNFYEHVHRQAGVALRTAVEVTGFEFDSPDGAVSGVCCSDGSVVPADLVLVGVGLVPNTELAQAAGLAVDNGIVVDEYARTSDSRIVAAGDCTNHPSPWSGCRVRLESVSNAIEQARSAAASLAGAQRRHDAVPWFWSDQYDLKLRMAGLSRGYDRLVLRGSMHSRSFAAFYLRDGRVIACDTVNRLQEFVAARRLVTCRAAIDPTQLADESVPLKDLVSGLTREPAQ